MPNDPRPAVENAARELLRTLADRPDAAGIRVAEVEGKLACLILVWDARRAMPTIGGERRRRKGGARAACRRDIVSLLESIGRPLTRKQVLLALRRDGKAHGPGVVARALAELTSCGELVNPMDRRGYRLPGWVRPRPGLFDEGASGLL